MPLFRPWNVERSSAIGRRLSLTIGVLALGGLPSVVGAAACTVRDLPLLEHASMNPGPDSAAKQMVRRATKITHRHASRRSDTEDLLKHPESPEYRARYLDSAEGLNQLIIDTIAMDDLPAFMQAIQKAVPAKEDRRRKTFLKLHIDPLSSAFDRGALDIVKQLMQWDPDGLKEVTYSSSLLGRVTFHWQSAAHRALDAEDDVSGVAKGLDKPVAETHAELVSMLLAAGANPKFSSGGLAGNALIYLAQVPPSPQVTALAEVFLKAGLSINARDSRTRSALSYAAEQQNIDVVRLMTSAERASQTTLDQAIAWTPMVEANQVVRFLLESGANVNLDGRTYRPDLGVFDPASWAASRFRTYKERELIRLLIHYKVDPNRTSNASDSALMLVIADPELALGLLELGANPNHRNHAGDTALLLATRDATTSTWEWDGNPEHGQHVIHMDPHERSRIVSALLSRGADANVQNKAGIRPLMQVSANDAESIDRLIEQGGGINLEDQSALSPYRLHDAQTHQEIYVKIGPVTWAALHRNDYLGAAWLARSSQLGPEDCGAVYFAAKTGAAKTLTALLDRKAETRLAEEATQRTPLMAAAGKGEVATVRILLDRHAAQVDESTPMKPLSPGAIAYAAMQGRIVAATGGETALMFAAQANSRQVVEELIRHGASVNRRDHTGASALTYARGFRATDVERVLLVNGAKE